MNPVASCTGAGRARPRQLAHAENLGLAEVDILIDLIAGPHHARPVQEIVAGEAPQPARDLATQLSSHLGHDGEGAVAGLAHVAGLAKQSAGKDPRIGGPGAFIAGVTANVHNLIGRPQGHLGHDADVHHPVRLASTQAHLAAVELVAGAERVSRADLLIDGSEVAAGPEGQAFLQRQIAAADQGVAVDYLVPVEIGQAIDLSAQSCDVLFRTNPPLTPPRSKGSASV